MKKKTKEIQLLQILQFRTIQKKKEEEEEEKK